MRQYGGSEAECLTIEQGQEIGKDGKVEIRITEENGDDEHQDDGNGRVCRNNQFSASVTVYKSRSYPLYYK
ncbi:hypothetical protein QNN00_25165 [Bacillus velezensis]|nr:hypothetical protein [Bacillus velezensis]